jgi:prepilin-type N-terminal cleavage/methylation domain-containing protein
MISNKQRVAGKSGFTLIELLVVISIMTLLAGLIVGLAAKTGEARKLQTTKAQLQELETAIERYKDKLGFYPPDNPTNVAVSPLFYELTGTLRLPGGDPAKFQTLKGDETILQTDIPRFFGRDGFANSGVDKSFVRNFFTSLKTKQFAEVYTTPDIEILVVPVEGPFSSRITNQTTKAVLNPWRYNVSNPTNNPGQYDLWAEVIIRGQTNIIGNWNN